MRRRGRSRIDAATRYEVRQRGGTLSLSGQPRDAAQTLNLSAGEWAALSYAAGNAAATDTIEVSAFDGIDWSAWASQRVDTAAPRLTAGSAGDDVSTGSARDETLSGGLGKRFVGCPPRPRHLPGFARSPNYSRNREK